MIKISDYPTAQSICSDFDCVISILDDNSEPHCQGNTYTFTYQFLDTLDGPTPELIRQLHQDILLILNNIDIKTILIHCHAGRSRSSAILMFMFLISGYEIDEAWDTILEIRPQADPNPYMIELIDNYLGMEGELINWRKELKVNDKWWVYENNEWTTI